ncbi:hypothetical protein [Nocardioides sp. MH1]|uniref:hypothetical protein n=1 Tax=Nocardioides sp. MH1 TaxID=3242490 RepID=UPI0035229155
MNRVITILLSVLVALVAVNAVLVWHAGQQAHEDAEHAHDDAVKQSCIQKAEATGIVVLLGGQPDKRLGAAQTLANQLDAC